MLVTISSSRRGWKRRDMVVAGRECGKVIVGEYRENGKSRRRQWKRRKVGRGCGKVVVVGGEYGKM